MTASEKKTALDSLLVRAKVPARDALQTTEQQWTFVFPGCSRFQCDANEFDALDPGTTPALTSKTFQTTIRWNTRPPHSNVPSARNVWPAFTEGDLPPSAAETDSLEKTATR
ncbi:unnamed protein product [[Candida] boidinii]|nr:unnamed protein product [[Candida] boidinii]